MVSNDKYYARYNDCKMRGCLELQRGQVILGNKEYRKLEKKENSGVIKRTEQNRYQRHGIL